MVLQTLFEGQAPAPLLNSPRLTGIAGLQSIHFASSDGLKLAAWYVSAKNGAVVILAHGTKHRSQLDADGVASAC